MNKRELRDLIDVLAELYGELEEHHRPGPRRDEAEDSADLACDLALRLSRAKRGPRLFDDRPQIVEEGDTEDGDGATWLIIPPGGFPKSERDT